MNCGPRCIQQLEADAGRTLSLRKAREYCRTNGGGATSPAGMVRGLETLGYRDARIREGLTWERLRSLRRRNHALVCWHTPYDNGAVTDPDRWDGHWCKVKRMTKQTITLYDPDSGGDIVLPREVFELLWRDVERNGGYRRPFVHAAVVARK